MERWKLLLLFFSLCENKNKSECLITFCNEGDFFCSMTGEIFFFWENSNCDPSTQVDILRFVMFYPHLGLCHFVGNLQKNKYEFSHNE